MKELKNNKGFTLIELLAVIVILGILMIVAIPMVSQYIKEAKQNAFVATAKAYVSSARYEYMNGDFECSTDIDSGQGGAITISFTDIKVDKTGGNSSFGKPIDTENSFVIISADANGTYTYYVAMRDKSGNGIDKITNEDILKKKHIKNNVAVYTKTNGTTARGVDETGAEKEITFTTFPITCTKAS